jgi:hypothetical protein
MGSLPYDSMPVFNHKVHEEHKGWIGQDYVALFLKEKPGLWDSIAVPGSATALDLLRRQK